MINAKKKKRKKSFSLFFHVCLWRRDKLTSLPCSLVRGLMDDGEPSSFFCVFSLSVCVLFLVDVSNNVTIQPPPRARNCPWVRKLKNVPCFSCIMVYLVFFLMMARTDACVRRAIWRIGSSRLLRHLEGSGGARQGEFNKCQKK